MSRRRPACPLRLTAPFVLAVAALAAAAPVLAQQAGTPSQGQQRPAQTQQQRPPQQQQRPAAQPQQQPQQQRPAAAPAQPQRAPDPPPMQVVGEFGDWAVYTIQEGGGRLCFMTSKPRSSAPANARRGEVRLMVTHWPSENTFDEVNFVPGYDFKGGSEATVQIGDARFALFTQGDKAWASDAETDKKIVDALRKGSRVTVAAVPERGANTTDTFGLNGSNKAYEEMSKACNVKR